MENIKLVPNEGKYKTELCPKRNKYNKELEAEINLKNYYSKKNVVPIMVNGTLYFYKISFKQPCYDQLKNEYEEELSSIESKIVDDNEYFLYYAPYAKYAHLRYNTEKVLKMRSSTSKELEKYLNIDENDKDKFIKENAKDIKIKVPIDNECWKEVFRKEHFDEIIERLANSTRVLEIKYKSKIYELMGNLNNNIDLEFIATVLYEFIINKYKDFSSGMIVTKESIHKVKLNSKERNLALNSKYKIIKNIYNLLNIECVYSKKIDDIQDFEYKNFLGSKEILIKIAINNSNILFNSEFSKIYRNIVSEKEFVNSVKMFDEEYEEVSFFQDEESSDISSIEFCEYSKPSSKKKKQHN